jgi:hypothetical protein
MKAFACALVVLGFAVPATAAAAESESGPLSPELTQLAQPAVAAQPTSAQAEAIGLPAEGPGSLIHEGDRVVVEAHFEAGALTRLEALKEAGARISVASRRYQAVALSVEPEDLDALAEVPGLSSVEASRAPIVYGAGETASTAVAPTGPCEGGSVISQGLEQMNVEAAREAFGARGAGETVGVLSDSFNAATTAIGGGTIATHAREDEETNDLPGPASTCSGQQVPVDVLAEGPTSEVTDEGRAMLQVVHDLAPHAELAFATAYSTELEFADNIERLAEPVSAGGAGADVIVDDVAYFEEPFFQEGPVANAIRKVTGEGVVYLTAAGNDNLIESGTGNEYASWERSEFHDTICPSVVASEVGEASSDCMNFSPAGTDATFGITVEPKSTLLVDLQWAEPWHGVKSDLDAYLLNRTGTSIVASGQADNITEGEPVEVLGVKNTSSSSVEVQLVIDRCIHNCNSAANVSAVPRLKFGLMEDGAGVSKTEYPESNSGAGIVVGPTIFGHAGSSAAITLGAVNYTQSATAPTEPERYSSRGPVTHYFGPVSGTTPAAELSTPEVIQKPNLTATDCASTTFFATYSSGWHFCGTSEAGPHAAAVAALMEETDPGTSPGAIRTAMEDSATPFTRVTACTAIGAGMLNADAAITTLGGGLMSVEESRCPATEESKASETNQSSARTTPSVIYTPNSVTPVVRITTGPKALGNESRPTFEFSSSRPVSFTCQIDGGAAESCASPYVVPTKLADGTHGFVVTGTSAEGLSGTSGVYEFTIDTKAPRTTIVVHPKKVIKTRKSSVVGRFRVRADEAPVTFYCQFDKEALRVCGKTFHRRFTPGVHVVKVRAMDAAGNIATDWTSYRFRVKQVGP